MGAYKIHLMNFVCRKLRNYKDVKINFEAEHTHTHVNLAVSTVHIYILGVTSGGRFSIYVVYLIYLYM